MPKIIVIQGCNSCPIRGECNQFQSLPKKTKVLLELSTGYESSIHKECPLPDKDN